MGYSIITQTGVGSSSIYPTNILQPNNITSLAIFVVGTANYTIEFTASDITASDFDPSTSVWGVGFTGTTSALTSSSGAWRGLRVTITSGTGTVYVKITQANISNNIK